MLLASSRLRLAVRSSSLALSTCRTCRAFSTAPVYGSLWAVGGRRSYVSTRAASDPPDRQHPINSPATSRDEEDEDELEESAGTRTHASTVSLLSPLDHLKRRGHFMPIPLPRHAPPDSSLRPGLQHNGQLLLGAQHYGKWRDLLFDYDRLLFEAGLAEAEGAVAAAKTHGAQRSVDMPEHATDLGLWSAILNFAQRRDDGDGALVVWREIFQRRQLHQTDGIVARAFWQTVLESALADEAFLESTWTYAEWMHSEHGALWPNYYRTVVTFCLDNGKYDRALRWHMRLSAHYGVAKRDFFDLLKTYLCDPDPELQDVLQSIYVTSRHRQLYDTIVPLLWSRGYSSLALVWRETLVRHDDLPLSAGASRPFLQYLAGYYPETELREQEQAIVNAYSSHDKTNLSAPPSPQKTADLPINLFYLMNRVHGDTFGIQEKPFNDKIGSKWFATRWVSLDTAINVVYSLGIHEIGPLSLQSIALREDGPTGVLHQLRHLDELNIGVGQSNYVRAMRHFAKMGDAETLDELLHSTIHPDVFDDVVLQRYVLGSASFTGDWKTHWLLLSVRLAVSEDAMVHASNSLLLACLEQQKKHAVLKLMDEFAARRIELQPAVCKAASDLVLSELPEQFDPKAVPDMDFCMALCRRMAAMQLPVATEAWQNMLFLLGRQGRLADLASVAVDIADRYAAIAAPAATTTAPEEAAFKVHVSDVPDVVREDQQPDAAFRLLPRDLPLDHPLHPLSLIFHRGLVEAIVRWYFHRKLAYRQKLDVRSSKSSKKKANRLRRRTQSSAPPGDFAPAGGIRLLAMLRDRGVAVPTRVVRSEALLCLAAVFGPPSLATRYWQPARAMNQLSLGEVKALCDAAWATGGGQEGEQNEELLPSLPVLEKAMEAIRPVAASFGNQLTQRGDDRKMTRDMLEAAANEPK